MTLLLEVKNESQWLITASRAKATAATTSIRRLAAASYAYLPGVCHGRSRSVHQIGFAAAMQRISFCRIDHFYGALFSLRLFTTFSTPGTADAAATAVSICCLLSTNPASITTPR